MILLLRLHTRKLLHPQWVVSLVYAAIFFLAIILVRQFSNIYMNLVIFFLLVISHKLLLSFIDNTEESAKEYTRTISVETPVNDQIQELLVESKTSFRHNSYELGAVAEYLNKTSNYLLGIFQDQFFILNKIEGHANKTNRLVQDVDLKISEAAVSSKQARAGADAGRSDIQNLSNSVQSLEEVGKLLSEFSLIIKELTSQMSDIDSIVHTSKILSFNATIEAARAGDYGKGFAVVAYEMRELTQKIGETSQNIQATLKKSNESLSVGGSRVRNLLTDSTGLIHSSQNSINLIIAEIYTLTEKITQISDSLSGYKKSSEELDEILSRISKTSTTLGTASANSKLARINLEDLKSFNEYCEDQLK